MSGAPRERGLIVDFGWAGAALAGEPVSGDAHVVAGFDDGALVAVVDGLGHGPEAAAASREAARILAERAAEPLHLLVQRCHEALRATRGAVMSLASFQRGGSMTWLGVGNVEGILLRGGQAPGRSREAITPRGGVVGYQLPALRPAALAVAPGDTLVLATDGIRSGFVADLEAEQSPQALAESILRGHARGTDDALVVVARYLGAPP
jgi:negative regulator of sigma-B (phosphoserine phosphatase)